MKQNEIDELVKLRNENYENIFNVYKDTDGFYFYNMLETVKLPELPDGYYSFYNITYGDTWPLVSYKNYNTPNLWWLILEANNIINPVSPLNPGSSIKILKTQFIPTVLGDLGAKY